MNLSEKTKQDLVFLHEDNVKDAPAFSSLNNFSETDAQVGRQEDWDFSAWAIAILTCVLSCSQVSDAEKSSTPSFRWFSCLE